MPIKLILINYENKTFKKNWINKPLVTKLKFRNLPES